jgi:Xaa-Pro aminopeptidase
LERERVMWEGTPSEFAYTDRTWVSDPVAFRIDGPAGSTLRGSERDPYCLYQAIEASDGDLSRFGVDWARITGISLSWDREGLQEWCESEDAYAVIPGLPAFDDLDLTSEGWHPPVRKPRVPKAPADRADLAKAHAALADALHDAYVAIDAAAARLRQDADPSPRDLALRGPLRAAETALTAYTRAHRRNP